MAKRILMLLVGVTVTLGPVKAQDRSQSRSMVISPLGIVASESVLASEVGARILENGGNAIDAAVATNAMMGLIAPMNDGIGGDLFAIIYDAKTRKLYGLNASGWAPAKLTADFVLEGGHNETLAGVKTMPQKGIHSVTVPGAVDGWDAMLRRFGTKTFADVLAPAITYAERGFPVAEGQAHWRDSEKVLSADAHRGYVPASAACRRRRPVRDPDLAWRTVRSRRPARTLFYRGDREEDSRDVRLSSAARWPPPTSRSTRPSGLTRSDDAYHGWTVRAAAERAGHCRARDVEHHGALHSRRWGTISVNALHTMIEARSSPTRT